ncbi:MULTISPECIES: 2Fe-2S iron-sulfur cluster-binding protein [Paraburkholderia]|uniref:2Fe-2S iron-sulfur cluster binding domain-containing protein n=1 Tax=Paraburkholderia tropica TaxID=92647 RepID=A0AAQ1GEU2_9BURK|nr:MULTISPECIES: 2Fe-2S iron-sulfur cluster-binding protein [Paraburkholderia]RQM44702.1 (2Fe-2S)-binding protein [Paraburkholderia bannensis]RQN38757.1 (2Fe-2S)-binding protein [Paraburkholderia tropica]SEJ59199.1 2Fe-2S iron-sulfur cluster binding domain-containing protein [Paraburkholderia tropica]
MSDFVVLDVDGRSVRVAAGSSVVAAIALATRDGVVATRRSVTGALRGPLCGMGVCQECRVTIDGVAHRLACQTVCAEGMNVVTARGAQ